MKRIPSILRRGLLRRAVAAAGLLAAVSLAVPGAAVDFGKAADSKGQYWALLIGVQGYKNVRPLTNTTNDVRQLASTLRERAGYPDKNVLEMVEGTADTHFEPSKANIQQELPAWLKQVGRNDTVMVYFSGHGFRDAQQNNKMYLAPLDCSQTDLAHTGIAVEWFRDQIDKCAAKTKFLVLDSCHAGSEKGDSGEKALWSSDLGETFQQIPGVFTLASSQAHEYSHIWPQKGQSLFSYWLNQGLKGHADENGDGVVDVDELYKYVYKNVTRTVKEADFGSPQTPTRIIRGPTPDVPAIANLSPTTLRRVLGDMTELLSNSIQSKGLKKVGVLEFTTFDSQLNEALGADFGVLGRYCATELEKRLAEEAENARDHKFSVVDRRVLIKSLKDLNFGVNDLGDTQAVKRLAEQTGGMPVIALGTLRRQSNRVVVLQCSLRRTDSNELVGSAAGAARLNDSEWGMLSSSTSFTNTSSTTSASSSTPPSTAPSSTQTTPTSSEIISTGEHPLKDPNFPYRVKLMFNGEERRGVFRGNNYYVPVRKGEVFEIWVENHSGRTVMMRLLIDGRNTLPEREETKGLLSMITGKLVNPDAARAWVLDPNSDPAADPSLKGVWAVRGFVTATGTNGEVAQFQVGDAPESVAGREHFADEIGIISAAFYTTAPQSRSVPFVIPGERKKAVIEEATGDSKVGKQLCTIAIHYVSYEALQKLQ